MNSRFVNHSVSLKSKIPDLQAQLQAKLRPTTTRVTNTSGKTYFESKSDDGTFRIFDVKADSQGIFMVIDNAPDEKLHHVIDGIYIGSQDAAINKLGLDECKITHIINAAVGIKNEYAEDFIYLTVPLLDLPETNIRQSFTTTNEFIKGAIDSNGRVLVHCNAGISRSSSIVLAYLIGVYQMTYDDAYELVKKARGNIRPNDGFIQQLKDYANEIAHHRHDAV